jgi:pyruvate/2-oxoglutarate dehydrogenase complex dihydrolipoamide dehydrogenase (E3) component
MSTIVTADICVIGAGAAGLSVAAGAAQLNQKVVLVEQAEMGGECLNSGCVPSKALIRAARAAYDVKNADRFGVTAGNPTVNFASTMSYVHDVIAKIAPHDSVERFRNMGVTVLEGTAQFIDAGTVKVGNTRVTARYFVIATGSKPSIPSLRGLNAIDYHTNETIFKLTSRPQHLLILGGGAVGLEMAQTFRRLGSRVTLIEQQNCLQNEDAETLAPVLDKLRAEGVTLEEMCQVKSVRKEGRKIILKTDRGDLEGSHLLIAAGRKPNCDELNLDRAGVPLENGFIKTDHRLRTDRKNIYAVGDVTKFGGSTHSASEQAGIVIRNMLFKIPAKIKPQSFPQAVYTDPEYARLGLTEAAARAAGYSVSVLRWPFSANDRALAEGDTHGLVKVVAVPNGRVLGVSISGAHAGDLLAPWSLMIGRKLKLSHIAGLIAPYPTRGEASKRAAGDFYSRKLFTPSGRLLVKLLSFFGR